MITALETALYTEIPLTRSVGISILDYSKNSLTLSAPLINNINHKCTAFGGSLYTVAVLSGWGLLYLLLKERGLSGQIVIQESNTKFIKPVDTDIAAKCSFQSVNQVERFINTYIKKGRARIQLCSSVICNGETRVLFRGAYVIHG